jgi:hypothetical protein
MMMFGLDASLRRHDRSVEMKCGAHIPPGFMPAKTGIQKRARPRHMALATR